MTRRRAILTRLADWLRTFRDCECCGVRSHDPSPGSALCTICMGRCFGDH